MKTKNAFAFRDFDSSRILQRPFFVLSLKIFILRPINQTLKFWNL